MARGLPAAAGEAVPLTPYTPSHTLHTHPNIHPNTNLRPSTKPIDWSKYGVVYAGAQKNLGPSGCTIMCIKDSLIGHADKDVPVLCDWDLHEKSPDTYYNTPCVWSMYVTGLNCSYMN